MKKITTILLGVASAFCLTAGVVAVENTAVAFAEEANTTVTLSETKFKVSDEQDKMLLVTAIQNYTNVYEVGYEFNDGYSVGENAVTATDKYYDSVTTTEKQTAEDIFGAGYEDAKLIVWEVAYAEGVTFNAYAKVGVIDGDELKIPEEEIKVDSTEKTNAKYTVTFMDGETEVSKTTVYAGKTVATPELETKWGYTLTWETNGSAYDPTQGVTENMTVNAVWTNNIESTDKTAEKAFTYDIYALTEAKANDTYACLLTDMTIFDEQPTALESVTLTNVATEESYAVVYDFENGLLLARTAEAETEIYTYVPAGEYVVAFRYNANQEVKVAMTLATKVLTEASELAAGLHTYADATEVTAAEGGGKFYDYDGYFMLGNDIECAGTEVVFSAPHGNSVQGSLNNTYDVNGKGFRGTFNGNGYAIKDAKFYAGGLFGEVASGAIIKNTKFENAAVYYAWGANCGILGVNLAAATIENCYFDVASENKPGSNNWTNASSVLAGWTYFGATIKNCVFNMRENSQSLPLVRNEGGSWNGVQGPYLAENVLIIYQTAEGSMIADRAGQTAMRANEFLDRTTINMTNEEVATVAPTTGFAFEVKTDNETVLAIDGAKVSGLQAGTANVWVEYTIGSYKVETAKVAVTVIAPVVNEYREIKTEGDLRNMSGVEGYTYKLMNDVTITAGSGTVIEKLNTVLDLNGYTITVFSTSATDKHFIVEIGATGVLKNGKISYFFGPTGATGHIGFIVNKNDGLVENVYIDAQLNSYADNNNLVGLFEEGNGTYRNVVVNVMNHTSSNYAGIFRAGVANLNLENCIFISKNVPLGSIRPEWGANEKTFEDFKTATNCILVDSVDNFTKANYDTTSFSSEYWTINETTKLPEMIKKAN